MSDVLDMPVSVENCSEYRAELLSLVKSNTDLQVIKTFDNEHQVRAYQAMMKEKNRAYLIERVTKVILKLGGLISAVSGAIAVILEVFI